MVETNLDERQVVLQANYLRIFQELLFKSIYTNINCHAR